MQIKDAAADIAATNESLAQLEEAVIALLKK